METENSIEVKVGEETIKAAPEMIQDLNNKIRNAAAKTVSATEIFKLQYYPLDGIITCNNKSMSIAKTFAASRDSLRYFRGETKIYVKAKIVTQGDSVVEFRIVKDLENKRW